MNDTEMSKINNQSQNLFGKQTKNNGMLTNKIIKK